MTADITNWASREDLYKAFQNVLEDLETKFERVQTVLSEQLFPVNKDTYHFVVKLLRPKNRLERAMCFHIFNTVFQSEVMSQGAGPAAFVYSVAFAKSLLTTRTVLDRNDHVLAGEYQEKMARLKTSIEALSRPPNTKDILLSIDQSTGFDKLLSEVVWQAVSLAGLEGKIFVENGKQSHYLLEVKEGYTFKVKPFKFFLNSSGVWEKPKAKVLVVDGLLEKVSEIDHLLTKSYETKQPLLLVAQGFSEEVVATLRANQERGNFESIPVRIMPDIESLNVINDIAIVCGTEPISSLKGELLTFVKYDDLPVVDMVRCNVGEMAIENSSSKMVVSSHIRALLQKRQDQKVDELQEFIDKRLRSLVANSVIINLPDMPPAGIDAVRVKLDNALRATKTSLNYGMVSVSKILDEQPLPADDLDRAIQKGLEAILSLRKEIPTLSIVSSTILSGKAMLLILAANGFVRLREN